MKARELGISTLIVVSLLLSGCVATESQSNGGKLAPSLEALIDRVLSREDLSEWDRTTLGRAANAGSISQADYEEGMNLFGACMESVGFKFAETKLLNGVIEYQPVDGVSFGDDVDAQAKAQADCYASTNAATQEIFRMQQANPDLLADFPQAAVNCLKKAGVVGDDFTKEQFQETIGMKKRADESAKPLFDVMSAKAHTCLYSLGYLVLTETGQ
ncbi:hypothetical protein [Microbacterium resistens]|nr:hypothetical protein [Microbacterium resistens]